MESETEKIRDGESPRGHIYLQKTSMLKKEMY